MSQTEDSSAKSLTEAYEQYADAIYRHCYFRVSQKEIAEDLMQDTFMRTWDYLKKGGVIENMRAFLYHVAHNLIVNYYKKKKHTSLDVLQEEGFDPASTEPAGMDVFSPEVIVQYLSQLDLETRDLLVMRFVDDMGPSEIAEVTGLSENVISVRMHRGIKKLRSLLHDDEV